MTPIIIDEGVHNNAERLTHPKLQQSARCALITKLSPHAIARALPLGALPLEQRKWPSSGALHEKQQIAQSGAPPNMS
jgi:hypothetical protein